MLNTEYLFSLQMRNWKRKDYWRQMSNTRLTPTTNRQRRHLEFVEVAIALLLERFSSIDFTEGIPYLRIKVPEGCSERSGRFLEVRFPVLPKKIKGKERIKKLILMVLWLLDGQIDKESTLIRMINARRSSVQNALEELKMNGVIRRPSNANVNYRGRGHGRPILLEHEYYNMAKKCIEEHPHLYIYLMRCLVHFELIRKKYLSKWRYIENAILGFSQISCS